MTIATDTGTTLDCEGRPLTPELLTGVLGELWEAEGHTWDLGIATSVFGKRLVWEWQPSHGYGDQVLETDFGAFPVKAFFHLPPGELRLVSRADLEDSANRRFGTTRGEQEAARRQQRDMPYRARIVNFSTSRADYPALCPEV